MNLKYDVMFIDEVVASVEIVNNKLIRVETFTDEAYKQPFLKKPVSLEYAISVLTKRAVQQDYQNIDGVLKSLGLDEYNPIEMVKRTHGVSFDDFTWIRFVGETLKWKDVEIRTER